MAVFEEPGKWFAVASPVWFSLTIGLLWLLIACLIPQSNVSSAVGVLVGMAVIAEALLPITKLQKAQDYVSRKPQWHCGTPT